MPSRGEFFALLILTGFCYLAHITLRRLLVDNNAQIDSPHSGSPIIKRMLPYYLSGLSFSLGLLLSGMSSPLKVLSFLQPLSPSFDPSLALIVVSGVIPNMIHYFSNFQSISSSCRPDLDTKVYLPWEKWTISSDELPIDRRLVYGAAIFGIGWGLAGACPGPVIIGLGQGWGNDHFWTVATFFAAMIGGMRIAYSLK
ncbi:MAG: hypothetical protein TREMPRED_005242 [Tremellales sp. Tagirdzhanova-0007]|nr:MAG: hypothetical protein TREMPRED_005242 [Tremellales sp. Tagirdzhanova-0007]